MVSWQRELLITLARVSWSSLASDMSSFLGVIILYVLRFILFWFRFNLVSHLCSHNLILSAIILGIKRIICLNSYNLSNFRAKYNIHFKIKYKISLLMLYGFYNTTEQTTACKYAIRLE